MRPLVSSLIAIALAIAPVSAMAAKPHKTAHAKVAQHDDAKADEKSDSADDGKDEDGDKAASTKSGKKKHAKHGTKAHNGSASIKPVVHHAKDVDLGGPGHKEPKFDKSGAIVPASMVTKTDKAEKAPKADAKGHEKSAHSKPKAADLPKLPNPHAGKGKGADKEKGARKGSEKKSEKSDASTSDDSGGQPERDEEFAELVARIRGRLNDASPDAPKGIEPDLEAPSEKSEKSEKAKVVSPSAKNTLVKPAACAKDPVEIVRGPEIERFQLTNCDGSLAPLAGEQLSILIRPGGAARPTAPIAELAKKAGPELAHGIRRVDPRLVTRLQALVDHFGKPGAPARIFVISGYRPASIGSMHSSGRAMDLRVEGARNEDVVAFCKTLNDTGCGYYPNSSFVHVDVRDAGAGHVAWIDASGPGETPRYVRSWPPPPDQLRAVDRVSTEALEREGVQILRARRPFERDAEPLDAALDDVTP